MNKIETLTTEQERMLDVVADEYTLQLLASGPSDRPAAEAAVCDVYRVAGISPPEKILWAMDPLEARAAAENCYGPDFRLAVFQDSCVYRKYAGVWLARLVGYFGRVLGIDVSELEPMDALLRQVEQVYLLDRCAILVERAACVFAPPDNPAEPLLRDLHNPSGPSFAYPSGRFNLYDIRGVAVTREIIEGNFTAQDITNQPNAEVRRVMLEKYGTGRYLRDIGAQAVHQDFRGTLFRAPLPGDEDLVMVRYVNRTAEPGMRECPTCKERGTQGIEFGAVSESLKREFLVGTFCRCGAHVLLPSGEVHKTYWHRVPPTISTATEAYVWMKPRLQALVAAGHRWKIMEES